MKADKADYTQARGVLPIADGDELPEARIARQRGAKVNIDPIWIMSIAPIEDQAVHDTKVNIELLKACFIELSKESQLEVYKWIYETFDHCRIYSK